VLTAWAGLVLQSLLTRNDNSIDGVLLAWLLYCSCYRLLMSVTLQVPCSLLCCVLLPPHPPPSGG
jgi:hypothetical protein